MKQFIWGGMIIGSTVGGFLPMLWSESALSMSSVILTAVGGVIGVWAGYQLGKGMGG